MRNATRRSSSALVRVVVQNREPLPFLDEAFLLAVEKEQRGVGLFLPTRAAVEQAALHVRTRWPSIHAAHYHGGEPIRAIRPFLEGTAPRPYVLAMTAAGQSALNVQGLDTIVIDDTRFANIVERGSNVLTRVHLGNNELLQMAGRVHGRVEGLVTEGYLERFYGSTVKDNQSPYPVNPNAPMPRSYDTRRIRIRIIDWFIRQW